MRVVRGAKVPAKRTRDEVEVLGDDGVVQTVRITPGLHAIAGSRVGGSGELLDGQNRSTRYDKHEANVDGHIRDDARHAVDTLDAAGLGDGHELPDRPAGKRRSASAIC